MKKLNRIDRPIADDIPLQVDAGKLIRGISISILDGLTEFFSTDFGVGYLHAFAVKSLGLFCLLRLVLALQLLSLSSTFCVGLRLCFTLGLILLLRPCTPLFLNYRLALKIASAIYYGFAPHQREEN